MVRSMWWIASIAGAGAPYGGLEWRPLDRGDLSWIDDERTTGLAVGEQDGTVSPALSAFFGGWLTDRFALQGSLGVARLTSTTWVGEVWEQRHWGVVRPGVDARLALMRPRDRWPLPWAILGLYGDIPSARTTSNGFDETEQEEADLLATSDRARLAGLGGRVGLGVDLRLHPAFAIGATYCLAVHRSLFLGDDPRVVTSFVSGQAAILATFVWDRDALGPPEREAGTSLQGFGTAGSP